MKLLLWSARMLYHFKQSWVKHFLRAVIAILNSAAKPEFIRGERIAEENYETFMLRKKGERIKSRYFLVHQPYWC